MAWCFVKCGDKFTFTYTVGYIHISVCVFECKTSRLHAPSAKGSQRENV